MKKLLIAQAAGILPVLLLSACAGGGSFDLDSVETKQHNPQPEAPKYQDEQTEKPAKPDEAQAAENERSAYGFAAKIPRRNWYKNKEDHKALSEADWEKLGAGEPGEFRQKNEIFAMDKGTLNESITTGDGKSRVEGYTDFKYVRSGYIYRNGANKIDLKNNIALFGPDGYLFYKGSNPSQALPTGKVGYKGTWDYVTDAKMGQKFSQLGNSQAGDRYGALSAEEADVLRNESEAPKGQTDFGLTSEFEVDFAAKTMTGALYRNNRITNNETENRDKQIKRYDIQANLHGNRFNGKATATDKPKENETKQHPFVSDSSSLSGGFFGPQGEELGFRFLSDDQKVAVVGSAKTKDKNANGNTPAASSGAGAATMPSETRLTTVLDAVELKLGDKEVQNLDNFSNAAQLVVDGIMIPLLPKDSESGSNQADKGKKGKNGKNGGTDFTYKTTYTPESDKKDAQAGTQTNGAQTASNTAGDTNGKTKTYEVEVCCSNLNYLKYGMLTRKNSKSAMQAGESSSQADAKTEQVEQSMFLQGERTDEKEIPSEQNIVYRGSWYGYIANDKSTSWSGNASNATSGNRAEFTVNFADKKITGTLTADNRQEATFTIDGNIKDNGFEGTAKTAESGFDLDQSNTTRTPKAYITDAKVQGGFYGPKAEELGGWFAYPGDKQTKNATNASGNSSATVVFGAKRQQPVR